MNLVMAEETRERWRELCELAVIETDPIRLAHLFHEIEYLLSDYLEKDEELDSGGVAHAAMTSDPTLESSSGISSVTSMEVASGGNRLVAGTKLLL
jgi:hypothetical protein